MNFSRIMGRFFPWLAAIMLLQASCNQRATPSIGQQTNGNGHADPITPDALYGDLYHQVQWQKVFPDGKTFVDCTPKRSPGDIMYDYRTMKGEGFNLRKFVHDNFNVPDIPTVLEISVEKDIRKHIESLWPILTRQPGTVASGSSLLPLPYPYIVPGGRFREVYYWDSYFTMLGLKVSGQVELIEYMVRNFAHLINQYGHIPNGNRTYYLSRSQPPFFGMMLALLAEAKADVKVYDTYLDALEKEYLYWMDGDKSLQSGKTSNKVVKTKEGYYLNRYFDERNDARPESYREDLLAAAAGVGEAISAKEFSTKKARDSVAVKRKMFILRNLRSGAESGWDFSSRWFKDPQKLHTIRVTQLIPVDLNCLLYFNERLLHTHYLRRGDTVKANAYGKWAAERAEAILKYCFDETTGFFYDYDFRNEKVTGQVTAAGLFPLYFLDRDMLGNRVEQVARVVRKHLLAPGGLLTTTIVSGQQWDAPNGWAPLQWMAVSGLDKCGQKDLAREIATRWIRMNKDVFARTGKMMEKYNVINTSIEAGGGEYPGQDGFGWTNGVLLALMEKYDARLSGHASSSNIKL